MIISPHAEILKKVNVFKIGMYIAFVGKGKKVSGLTKTCMMKSGYCMHTVEIESEGTYKLHSTCMHILQCLEEGTRHC